MWISIETSFRPRILIPLVRVCFFEGVTRLLSEPDRVLCEGQISLADLSASLKTLNTAKAPGSDGLTVEFFF